MIINKVEIGNLDLYDADAMEKYENALAEVAKKNNEAEKIAKTSEKIRQQCNIIFDFFNSLFGADTDVKIFGGKTNLLVCLKAFEELITQVNEQRGELQSMLNKYSPNRAATRVKNK